MDGTQGMFGQDPALIQQAIQQQRQQDYNAAANTPQGRGIVSLGAQAGGMLGDALGTATGVQDPRIAEAQLGQQVQQKVVEQAKMQGIDPVADPEGFIKLVAQGWMDAGKPDKAYAAVNTLQQMQAQKSKMGLEGAQAQAALHKATMENDPAVKLVQSGKISPAQYAQYKRGEIGMEDLALISTKADAQPFYQFIPGPGGEIYTGNARTGDLARGVVEGKPVVRADFSVPLQTELAKGKKAGAVLGEAQTQAEITLPKILSSGEQAINQVDELLKHPGFNTTVGATLLPGARYIPGTDASDFMARLNQVKGGSFLEAYNVLKGGGQITEIEGKKATDAINAMDISQSEEEFQNAAKRYVNIVKAGMERAKRGIVVNKPITTATTASTKPAQNKAVSLDDYLKSQGY